MPVTSYHTINGQIVGESTSGARIDYLRDALGSVTATTSSAGTILNKYRYKPYGANLSKSGTAPDPKFQWVGHVGYRSQNVSLMVYVRRRHYRTPIGSWSSADFAEKISRYPYVDAAPTVLTDSSGEFPDPTKTPDCCVNNKPGKTRKINGRNKCIEIKSLDKRDSRYTCWLTTCHYCSDEHNNYGVNVIVSDFIDKACADQYTAYEVLRCIGQCSDDEVKRRGCELSTFRNHGAAPWLRPIQIHHKNE